MLTLPIKKKWFYMILAGEKREEYRNLNEYYQTRLRNVFGYPAFWGEIHEIILKNGYAADAPKILIRASLAVRTGRIEWGAKPDVKYFVLKIHEVYNPIQEIQDNCNDIIIWRLSWTQDKEETNVKYIVTNK